MNIVIRELSKKDYRKAVRFAITGMHFNWYMDSRLLLWLYGTYFWYKELTRATQVIAAYVGDAFAGVLLAEVYGEKRVYASFWKSLYVRFFEFLQRAFSKSGAGLYEQTTEALLAAYRQTQTPDGEILFLAPIRTAPSKGWEAPSLRSLNGGNGEKSSICIRTTPVPIPFTSTGGLCGRARRLLFWIWGTSRCP